MKRILILLLAGLAAVLLQVTIFTWLPFGGLKPDLLLIVVLFSAYLLAWLPGKPRTTSYASPDRIGSGQSITRL